MQGSNMPIKIINSILVIFLIYLLLEQKNGFGLLLILFLLEVSFYIKYTMASGSRF